MGEKGTGPLINWTGPVYFVCLLRLRGMIGGMVIPDGIVITIGGWQIHVPQPAVDAIIPSALAALGALAVFVVIRWNNRRSDSRHAKRPPDPP